MAKVSTSAARRESIFYRSLANLNYRSDVRACHSAVAFDKNTFPRAAEVETLAMTEPNSIHVRVGEFHGQNTTLSRTEMAMTPLSCLPRCCTGSQFPSSIFQ